MIIIELKLALINSLVRVLNRGVGSCELDEVLAQNLP